MFRTPCQISGWSIAELSISVAQMRDTKLLTTHLGCREDRSYIITGGLGGFGLALAVWLANAGAKNLVMTSKRGMRTGGQRKVIEMLRSRGVKVSLAPL